VLKDLNENHGKTIIVIEHHTEFIAKYCKNIIMMQNGEILWFLPTKKALNLITDFEQNDVFPPQITQAAKLLIDKGIINENTMLPVTNDDAKIIFKNLKFINNRIVKSADNKYKEITIEINGVSTKYRTIKEKPKSIINNLNLKIFRGEKIALIGNNGAGKSTLLKILIGIQKKSEGNILIDGIKIEKYSPNEFSKKISFIFQNPEEMFINDTIRKDIEYSLKVRNCKNYDLYVEKLIEVFKLKDIENLDGRLLSGGQMRRASIAIGIALRPSILLLDEPTANLDIATKKTIIEVLEKLNNKIETVIVATHDMELVSEWASRIIVLDNGNIIADGSKEEIFNNEYLLASTGIKPPSIFNMAKMLNSNSLCFSVKEFSESFINSDIGGAEKCSNFQKTL
jgi:energy-coupling factor transport system ATP-binding protein